MRFGLTLILLVLEATKSSKPQTAPSRFVIPSLKPYLFSMATLRYMVLVLLLFGSLGILLSACGGSAPSSRGKPSTKPLPLSPTRKAIVAEAKRWLGTPYRFGGNSRDGVDCSGYVCQVFLRFDILLARTSEEQYSSGNKISRSRLQPGDLVFFSASKRRGVTHVGIYLGENAFIHASTSRGVMISRLTDEYYARRYTGAVCVVCGIR